MRYFLDISYRGSAFHGWQTQKNANSVQDELNSALSTLLRTETGCTGSGRTDTGVHATRQVAHFDSGSEIDLCDFRYKLNAVLPAAIGINAIRKVKTDAHARFSALSRSYRYFIHSRKDPFRQGLSYYFAAGLDIDTIRAGLQVISGWKNFQAFSKVHTDVNHYNCEIFDIHWEPSNSGHCFSVSANRFLRGMVRAMVGTLLELGTGRLSCDDLIGILESGNRSLAGRAVPPEGLYLTDVIYPEEIYID